MHPSATDSVLRSLDAKLPIELQLVIAKSLGVEEYFTHRNADYCTRLGELSAVLCSDSIAFEMLRLDETHNLDDSWRPKMTNLSDIGTHELREREDLYLQHQKGFPKKCCITFEGNGPRRFRPTRRCRPVLSGHMLAFASEGGVLLYDAASGCVYDFSCKNVKSIGLTSKLIAYATDQAFYAVRIDDLLAWAGAAVPEQDNASATRYVVDGLAMQCFQVLFDPQGFMAGCESRIACCDYRQKRVVLFDGEENTFIVRKWTERADSLGLLLTNDSFYIFCYVQEPYHYTVYAHELSWAFDTKDKWEISCRLQYPTDWYGADLYNASLLISPTGYKDIYQLAYTFSDVYLTLDLRTRSSFPEKKDLTWKNREYEQSGCIFKYKQSYECFEPPFPDRPGLLVKLVHPALSIPQLMFERVILINDTLLALVTISDEYDSENRNENISIFTFDQCGSKRNKHKQNFGWEIERKVREALE